MLHWLAATVLLASPLDSGKAVELRYTGTLTKLSREAEAQPAKRLSLYVLVTPKTDAGRQVYHWVDERGAGSWPWPERFGHVALDAAAKPQGTPSAPPRLLYEHNQTKNPMRLPRPLLEQADRIQAGATWQTDALRFEVRGAARVQDRDCWQVDAANNFGRKRTYWVEKGSPLIVEYEERVFVGQGEEHSLKLKLDSLKELADEDYAKNRTAWEELLKLQQELAREENEVSPDLTTEQLAKVVIAAPKLEKVAEGTSLSRLAGVITRDTQAQQQRTGELAQLSKKFLGQPAPEFELKLSEGAPVKPGDRAGKITVLHFWEYKAEPLEEPYGQVGYLDFLNSRRRKLGVQCYGVAVDERFANPTQAGPARRSMEKLKGFMNLSYGVALDDGTLLEKFGDPRRVGAKLPLWVVIGPDGKILHYHVGFYQINPDEGLRQLDEVLVEAIKASGTTKGQ